MNNEGSARLENKVGDKVKVFDIVGYKKGHIAHIDVTVIGFSGNRLFVETARGRTGHLDIGSAGDFFSTEDAAFHAAWQRAVYDSAAADRVVRMRRTTLQNLRKLPAYDRSGWCPKNF